MKYEVRDTPVAKRIENYDISELEKNCQKTALQLSNDIISIMEFI